MRNIYDHQADSTDDTLQLVAVDEPTNGGASHHYQVLNDEGQPITNIFFQCGPVADVGVNGVTGAALLTIVLDQLRSFQAGPFASRENALAITKLEETLHRLHDRTRDRKRRGVEGTLQK